MNERQLYVAAQCEEAMHALRTHAWAPGTEGLLAEIRERVLTELDRMRIILDPGRFRPTYPRLLVDSLGGADHELLERLMRVAYEYDRIREDGEFRSGVPRREDRGEGTRR